MNGKNFTPKNARKFICENCDFGCCKQSDWNRHLMTSKHQNGKKNGKNGKNGNEITPNDKYVCECGKYYSHQSGLVRHKKAQFCAKNATDHNNFNDVNSLTNLVLEVVKQNKELVTLNTELTVKTSEAYKQNQELTNRLVEMCGNTTNNTQINNSNSFNNNKTFNLNVFLNETCKDAMNITEFVDSLQLQLSDLEEVGKLGFVEGISKIIVKNLKALDVHKRPVHCADKKREVIYIKDDDKWEKENEQKVKLRKAIKTVAYKNEKLLPKFKDLHPGCNYSDSKYADHYSKLVIEALGGSGNNDIEKQDKIIKNIAKEIVIDKINN
jgi:hypothetical protein